jgi:diacylglycerol kinase
MRDRKSTEKYRSFLESTIAAGCGLIDAIRREKKIRQVFVCLIVATITGAWADVGYFQILMVIFSWVVALICETFNTAIENALDYASGKEYHPLIKKGKDYAAACTFVSVTFAVLLSLFVLWDRYYGEAHPRAKTYEATPSPRGVI